MPWQPARARSSAADPNAACARANPGVRSVCKLFRLDVLFPHYFYPAVVVLADAVPERLRGAAARDHAVGLEGLLDGRVVQRLVDRAVERRDDRLWNPTRRHRPEPEHDLVPG